MHELGLAIDITCGGSTVSSGGACFSWLTSHAADYGLCNLPSEPWHWSTDGT
jgi:zinc D-Ala-D-Ala carboxypeptidase